MTLDRFAVVRRVPPARWATVVAALLDGVSLVMAEVPRGIGAADARRLVARARERDSILVVCAPASRWQAGAALTLRAESSAWVGLDDAGFLRSRSLHVHVEGRGRPRVRRSASLPVPSERVCCLWCPDWPIVAARVRDPELHDAPVAIMGSHESPTGSSRAGSSRDRGPVVQAASVEARREGVSRGLRRREAEARCAELTVIDSDDAADAARVRDRGARGRAARAAGRARSPGPVLVPHARPLPLLRR